METNYHAQQTPQFRVLSDEQIKRVYQATLECLNRTGVNIHNAEARQLLAQAGAHVDGMRVRIPPHIIQDAVASNPRSFTIWGRDGKHRMNIVPDHVYFGPGPTCTYFIDPDTGEMRKTRRRDPGLTAKVCDALDNIDYVMSLGLIDDVTPRLAPVYEFAEMLANTGKPVLPWAYTAENVADIYQMAVAVAGSEQALRERPIMAFFSTYQSPLVQTDEDLANVMWAVEHDIPVVYIGGGCAGTICANHRRRNLGDLAGGRAVRAGRDAIEKTWRGGVHWRRTRGDGFADCPATLWRAGDEPVQRSSSGYLPLFRFAFHGDCRRLGGKSVGPAGCHREHVPDCALGFERSNAGARCGLFGLRADRIARNTGDE